MSKSKKKAGQTLVEYGLIIALVSAVLIGTLLVAKSGISNTFSKVTSEMESASN
ncbi:MAG: Flp family type IVb pilin [Verrucomicrobiota bacterium]